MLRSIPRLYPLDARSIPTPSSPGGDNQKCLQALPDIPEGQNQPWWEITALEEGKD